MTHEIVHALKLSTMAGSHQHAFDCHGLCLRELIFTNQAVSAQATKILISNLIWLM